MLRETIDLCLSRSRTMVTLFVLILIFGMDAYQSIPKEDRPDIPIPYIFISVTHRGISPEDGERLLIKPMETALKGLEGVKKMTSTATEGVVQIVLEFEAGFDSKQSLQDVRDKVDDAKSELPEASDEPIIQEINIGKFPILNVIIRGSAPERMMNRLADKLRQRVEEVPTVLEAKLQGKREEVVEIVVDPLALQSYNFSLSSIRILLESNNKLIASGAIERPDGRFVVKVPALIDKAAVLRSIPIKKEGDTVVTLEDVATIKRTYKTPTSIARVNGEPALVLEVSKRTGTNIIETIDNVKAVVEQETAYWPENMHVVYSQDNSRIIRTILHDLENNIIAAVLLALLPIILTIGIRSAALSALSVPGSFLMGVLILYMLGYSLNIVVLFSLILSIGMLVDAAIVVTEYADRKIVEGEDYRTAYSLAAKRMALPILSATATTLVVFAPLLVWPGIVGEFMRYMPITLNATVLSSLVIAFYFLPSIGPLLGKPKPPTDEEYAAMTAAESEGNMEKLAPFPRWYATILQKALKAPGKVTLAMISILTVVYLYFALIGTGVEFFPRIEPENAYVSVLARGNLSMQEKEEYMREVEERILPMTNDVRVFYTTIGGSKGMSGPPAEKDQIGVIYLEYQEWGDRRKSSEVLADIRNRTSDLYGIIVKTDEERRGPGAEKPINIEVHSKNFEDLPPAVSAIRQYMATIPGIISIEDDTNVPEIEWQIKVDREKAARYGADISMVGDMTQLLTNGLELTTYRPDDTDDEVDIVLRFPENKRRIRDLNTLQMVTADGTVPLSNFITREPKLKTGSIIRIDGNRSFSIKADVLEGENVSEKIEKIKAWIASNPAGISDNVRANFAGEDEEQREAQQFLSKAFILALVVMALIFLTQFNRYSVMVIILSAVFLSTVGVLLGLIITDQPFGIVMCGVGIIALAGIVVNNNIIFIDTFQQLKDEGHSTKDALIRTGVQRLRPILLTAGTGVLGLLPMVFAMTVDFFDRTISIGYPSSQWWRQLSTTIAGGLTFATILTLILTPCLIVLIESFTQWLNQQWSKHVKMGR